MSNEVELLQELYLNLYLYDIHAISYNTGGHILFFLLPWF